MTDRLPPHPPWDGGPDLEIPERGPDIDSDYNDRRYRHVPYDEHKDWE